MAKDFDNDLLMEEIDINQYMSETSSTIQNDSQMSNSEISRSDLYSNIQNVDNCPPDELDYVWLQPYSGKDDNRPSREDRRTESNILTKKNNRMSEEQVHKIFKTVSSAIHFEQGYF